MVKRTRVLEAWIANPRNVKESIYTQYRRVKVVEVFTGQTTLLGRIISADPKVIANADRVILPGVGAFGHCMQEVQKRGIVDAIYDIVRRERPLFGICVGMQILS